MRLPCSWGHLPTQANVGFHSSNLMGGMRRTLSRGHPLRVGHPPHPTESWGLKGPDPHTKGELEVNSFSPPSPRAVREVA